MIDSKKAALYAFTLAGMSVGAWQLRRPEQSVQAASCCQYGTDCGNGYSCCFNAIGQAKCSPGKWYYCKPGDSCN